MVAIFFGGCGGKNSALTMAPASSEDPPDLGLAELRKSLESTVLENYDQLTYGNIEAFVDGVATDRDLQMIGVEPSDLITGKSPAAIKKDRRLYRDRNLRILSKNLNVQLSRDGSVGWIFDEPSYRVDFEGREASIPIRNTAVYVRDVDRWVLVAEHLSYGVPVDDIVRLSTGGTLEKVPRVKTNYGGSREAAAPLIGLVGTFINAGGANLMVPEDDRSVVLLPGPEQEYHNEVAPALAGLFGVGATVALREFRIQMAASKSVAWMLASLAIRTQRNGDSIEIPLRASFVLERAADKSWGIVQAHISAPVLETQLSARAFGERENL